VAAPSPRWVLEKTRSGAPLQATPPSDEVSMRTTNVVGTVVPTEEQSQQIDAALETAHGGLSVFCIPLAEADRGGFLRPRAGSEKLMPLVFEIATEKKLAIEGMPLDGLDKDLKVGAAADRYEKRLEVMRQLAAGHPSRGLWRGVSGLPRLLRHPRLDGEARRRPGEAPAAGGRFHGHRPADQERQAVATVEGRGSRGAWLDLDGDGSAKRPASRAGAGRSCLGNAPLLTRCRHAARDRAPPPHNTFDSRASLTPRRGDFTCAARWRTSARFTFRLPARRLPWSGARGGERAELGDV
jgi:hypothetical protein